MLVYTASKFTRNSYGTGGTRVPLGIFSSYDKAFGVASDTLAHDQWSNVTIIEHALDEGPTGREWFIKNVDGEIKVS